MGVSVQHATARIADPTPTMGPTGAVRTKPLRIGLLGPLTVTVDGVDVPVGGPSQRRAATALAVAAMDGAALTVSDLIDVVYQDDLPPRPRRSLATVVWRLRRQWGTDTIVSDGYTYRLAPDACSIDADEFEEQLNRGRALARRGEDAEAAAVLRSALSIWRAPQEPEPAMPAAERARLLELRLGAMDHLAQSLARCRQHSAAIELLEQIVAVRPEWEHSQAQLIDSHIDSGDWVGGRRVYDHARRTLSDQGVDPGPDLQRVAERLAAAAAGTPLPGDTPALPAQATVTAADPGAPQLIGRHSELDHLVSAVAGAIGNRRPATILVTGEPGIGKSTLIHTALAALPANDRTTRTMTPEDLLDGWDDGDTVQVGKPGQLRAALLHRVRAITAATGLVLLIEDVHRVPPTTADAIAALLSGAGGEPTAIGAIAVGALPLVVIVTARDRAGTDVLSVQVDTHLHLRGLSLDAVAELVGAGPDDARAEQLHRLTGGNPRYLHHVRRSGAKELEELPADVTAAIETHLGQEPSEVVDALEIAAVAGVRFDLTVLFALSGRLRMSRPVWIDRLTAATHHGLIRPDRDTPGRYSFVHSLVRDHLYRRMPAQARTTAHAELGRAFDRIAVGTPYPADLLVYHYTRGWPETTTREVVGKLGAAARTAAAQREFGQAAAHYRTLLDHLAMDPAATDASEIADTIGDAAKASAAAGDLHRAHALYASQRGFAENARLPLAHMAAALGVLTTGADRHARPQIAEYLAGAVADAADECVLHERPELAAESVAAVQMYRPHLAEQILQQISRTEPTLTGRLRLAIWEHRSVSGQLSTARQLVEDPTAEPVAAWLRLWVSEVAAGLRAFDDPPPCRVPLHHADDRTRSDLNQWRICGLIATGQLGRAHSSIDRALAATRHPDPAENARRQAGFLGQRVYLELATGDAHAAQRSAQDTNPVWTSRHPVIRRYASAQLLAATGDHERARELCDELLEDIGDPEIPESDLLPRLVALTGACLGVGHRAALGSCLTHLLPHRGEHATFHLGHYWGVADYMIGQLQVVLGDLDAGIGSLGDAVDALLTVHAEFHVPIARRKLADALHLRDRPGDRRLAAEQRGLADETDRAIGVNRGPRIPAARQRQE